MILLEPPAFHDFGDGFAAGFADAFGVEGVWRPFRENAGHAFLESGEFFIFIKTGPAAFGAFFEGIGVNGGRKGGTDLGGEDDADVAAGGELPRVGKAEMVTEGDAGANLGNSLAEVDPFPADAAFFLAGDDFLRFGGGEFEDIAAGGLDFGKARAKGLSDAAMTEV